MLQDSINDMAGITNIFPDIKEFTITNKNHVTIFLGDQELKAKTFTNSFDLLEWYEINLKSILDDIRPKNIITSLFYRLKKNRKTLEF
jgi:hypothetical protein